MSADGSRLVAAVQNGLIYVSTNAGSNWTGTSAPVTNWSFIASSADGNRLAALANAGGPGGGAICWIFTSGDGGATWTQCTLTDPMYSSLALSADGNKLAALPPNYNYHGGRITCSTNFGASWSNLPGPFRGFSITCAAEGWYLFVATASSPGAGQVWASTNFGITWNLAENGADYLSIFCSADGQLLVAQPDPGFGGQVQISTNSGAAWTTASLPPSSTVWNLASSADGSILIAASVQSYWPVQVSLFYVSTNSGTAWASATPPSTNAASLSLSADGKRIAASTFGGGIYTWQTTPTPVLSFTPSAGSLLISWIVPSLPFVLQENADLTTSAWTDVTATPNLNFTNLHHEVTMPLSSTKRFYRLRRSL